MFCNGYCSNIFQPLKESCMFAISLPDGRFSLADDASTNAAFPAELQPSITELLLLLAYYPHFMTPLFSFVLSACCFSPSNVKASQDSGLHLQLLQSLSTSGVSGSTRG